MTSTEITLILRNLAEFLLTLQYSAYRARLAVHLEILYRLDIKIIYSLTTFRSDLLPKAL